MKLKGTGITLTVVILDFTEHSKRYKPRRFLTPQDTTNIPVTFIWRSPPACPGGCVVLLSWARHFLLTAISLHTGVPMGLGHLDDVQDFNPWGSNTANRFMLQDTRGKWRYIDKFHDLSTFYFFHGACSHAKPTSVPYGFSTHFIVAT